MPKTDVQLGQRFQSSTGFVWEVLRIANLTIPPRHVVIVDINDHTASKMIAETALLEPHLFQPAP